jgi:uncharacterized protein involved in propanediol utilization
MRLQKCGLSEPIGKGSAFGSFGELLQGVGTDNQDFLVTFPIDRFSTALFMSVPNRPTLTVIPGHKYKTERLANLILHYFGLPAGGILELESTIPVGKGLASSSADLVATARAIDNCFGLDLSVEQMQNFLRKVEPTDGVMYEGIVAFYHRNVILRKRLGYLPALTIVSIDEGGEVDTIEFNKRPKLFVHAEKEEYDQLFEKIVYAIDEQDLRAVGEVAQRSAALNQRLHKKHYFEQVMEVCQKVGGLGVVVAHSGPCLGILLSSQHEQYHYQLHLAFEALRQLAGNATLFHSWCPVSQVAQRP